MTIQDRAMVVECVQDLIMIEELATATDAQPDRLLHVGLTASGHDGVPFQHVPEIVVVEDSTEHDLAPILHLCMEEEDALEVIERREAVTPTDVLQQADQLQNQAEVRLLVVSAKTRYPIVVYTKDTV